MHTLFFLPLAWSAEFTNSDCRVKHKAVQSYFLAIFSRVDHLPEGGQTP